MDYKSLTPTLLSADLRHFIVFLLTETWRAMHIFGPNLIIRIIRNNYSQTYIFGNGLLTAWYRLTLLYKFDKPRSLS